MSRLPIRVRLTLAFAVAVAAVLAVAGVVVYARLGTDLTRSLDQGLRSRAQDLSAALRARGSSLADADQAALVEPGESYTQLVDPSGRILDASRFLHEDPVLSDAELARARGGTFILDRPPVPGLDEPSRALVTPIPRAAGEAVLVVGVTSSERDEALASLRRQLAIGFPAALLLLSLGGYLLSGAALRPIEAMRRRAAEVSERRPADRLPVPPARDEVRRLAETLNAMLARLHGGIERERRLVADAGHELRTPLALLKTELEVALRSAVDEAELREAMRSAVGETDRVAQLADNLLVLADSRSGPRGSGSERCDACMVARTVARRLDPGFRAAGRALTVDAPGEVAVAADTLRVEQALTNLLDNALRHGGGGTELRVTRHGDSARVSVADRGAGVAAEFLPRAFQPFTRPEEHRGRPGAGLGLAIVRALADGWGGSCGLANREGGGAETWFSVPAASDGPATR